MTNRKRSVAVKLTVIARQLRQRFDQSVERSGVTRAGWSLIAAVARNPGATQRMVADMLEVTEVTAGRLIDRLCAEGLVERRADPHDRRAYRLYTTEAAGPVLERLSVLAVANEDEAFAGLGDGDLATLEALLDVVARNLADARGQSLARMLKPGEQTA